MNNNHIQNTFDQCFVNGRKPYGYGIFKGKPCTSLNLFSQTPPKTSLAHVNKYPGHFRSHRPNTVLSTRSA